MSDEFKNKITAESSRQYMVQLKIEFEQKRDELRAKLVDPSLSDADKANLKASIDELENEFKSKSENIAYSLF
jgi:hypothetical protein